MSAFFRCVPAWTWHLWRTALLGFVCAFIGGCGNAMPFDIWVKRYNATVDRAQNDLLLTNIVRAGRQMPLTFTSIQVVRGNGQVTNTLGVGNTATSQTTSQWGTPTTFNWTSAFTPTAGTSISDGFNFDVSVLDTAEFLKGLLTAVTPDVFHFYLGQGVPTEMLLNLLVERITIVEGSETRNYYNDPLAAHYEAFRTVLSQLIDLGLTTELVSIELPVGPVLTPTEAGDVKNLVAAATAGLIPKPVRSGGFQLVKITKAARFCFMEPKPHLPELPPVSLCKDSPARKGRTTTQTHTGAETLEFAKASMSVQLRSTRSLFAYLGALAVEQIDKGSPPPEMKTPAVKQFAPPDVGLALFRVSSGLSGQSIATADYRGTTYSIPVADQGVSATVLSILSQLMTLSKSVNSIPNTGTVVVAR